MIRVLIVDDQALFRDGLRALLSLCEGIVIVGEASDGNEALALVSKTNVDVVIMDIRMPRMDGISASRILRERFPRVRILVLTTFNEDELIERAIQAGANGYVLKNIPSEDIASLIHLVHKGYVALSQEVAANIGRSIGPTSLSGSASAAVSQLSVSERNVLVCIGRGMANAKIASTLHLSDGTVRNAVTAILTKLGLHSRLELGILANRMALQLELSRE